MEKKKVISLPHLRSALIEMTGTPEKVPNYRALYGKVLDGTIPAKQENGRWTVTSETARELAQHYRDQD
jgi:hypothetical protein